MCKASDAAFKEAGYREGGLDSFINHYDAQLGKCFILIASNHVDHISRTTSVSMSEELFDTYERKMYGSLITEGDLARGAKLLECWVFMPSGEKKTCQSAAEFTNMLTTYMGPLWQN